GRDSTSTYAYSLQVAASGQFNPHKVMFELYDGTNNPQAISTTTLEANKWYVISGTYDGSTLRIFVNGTQESSTATTVNPGAQTSPLAIGKNANNNNRYFNGTIDEPKVYNQAHSAAQVL